MTSKVSICYRNSTFDLLKGILIILVILGHWLEHGFKYETNRIVFNYIYLFHMPLFILISGYFSKKTDFNTFKKKILSLLEIYAVVQALYIISSIILQGKSYGLSILYIPNAAAWYLLSLICWRIILQAIPTKHLLSKYLLYLSLLICILSGYLPINNNELSILRTFTFLPFFFYGYAIKNKIVQIDNKFPLWISYCMLVIMFGFIIFIGSKDLSSILYFR